MALPFLRFFLRARSRTRSADAAGLDQVILPRTLTGAARALALAGMVAAGVASRAGAEEESPEAATRSAAQEEVPADETIRYFLERIEVRGNTSTRRDVIVSLIPLRRGDVLDVDDPRVERIRWRLLGTGWFGDVRLSLSRGSRRGWVVLQVDVVERNTFVIQQVAAGVSEGVERSSDRGTDLVPYIGLGLAERNLLGSGMGVGVSALVSKPQQGVWLRFSDPFLGRSTWQLNSLLLYNNARDFFGNDPIVSIACPDPDAGESCPPEIEARNAVVLYERFGVELGTGHGIRTNTNFRLDWHGELVDVRARPDAASEVRGGEVVPIDFSINQGRSLVSLLRLTLAHDRRDNPALPTRGVSIETSGEWATGFLGSDYDFVRLRGSYDQWFPLGWGGRHGPHHVRIGIFAGVVLGRAPFFFKFYASDLSDLIPSRVLDMNIDRRPPPDLFGTAIGDMRIEELAGRVDIEYGFPLYRGERGLRALMGYVGTGVYSLADTQDLVLSGRGLHGFERVPIDMTVDLGLRADTAMGVFQLGLSTVLGFVTP